MGDFIFGILVSIAVCIGISSYFPYSAEIVKAITECEVELPRNQKCTYVITAEVVNE